MERMDRKIQLIEGKLPKTQITHRQTIPAQAASNPQMARIVLNEAVREVEGKNTTQITSYEQEMKIRKLDERMKEVEGEIRRLKEVRISKVSETMKVNQEPKVEKTIVQ